MTYLNSPSELNPLELHILTQLPQSPKTGLVVGAGDGRLVHAINAKYEKSVTVHAVESRPELHKYLSGLGALGKSPWALDFYEKIAQGGKGIDFIVFYNIHEYWKGDVYSLYKICKLVNSSGKVIFSFYNFATLHEIGRKLVPVEAGIHRLGSPVDIWPQMDLSSWAMFCDVIGLSVGSVWGALESDAFKFCQEKEKKGVKWELKGYSVEIKELGDAYIMGAPVICLGTSVIQSDMKPAAPVFSGVEADASMIQGILFPYGHISYSQLNAFDALLEVLSWKGCENAEKLPFFQFVLAQLQDFQPIGKVLILGAGWGEGALIVKHLQPKWKIECIENSIDLIGIGSSLLAKGNLKAERFDPESALPYDEDVFDIVFSFQYFSSIYQPLAEHLARESLRVSRKGVVHLEDLGGASSSVSLKSYSLAEIYQNLGKSGEVLPLEIDNKPSQLYLLKVKK